MEEWLRDRERSSSLEEFDEGEEYSIYDGEGLASGIIKHEDPESEFPSWFREMGNRFGCKVYDSDEYLGHLVGMSYTYLDYYYIVQDDDYNIRYISCVGKLKFE